MQNTLMLRVSMSTYSASSPVSKAGDRPASVAQVLANPILLEKVTDRVYALLQQELRQQQERVAGYGAWRGL